MTDGAGVLERTGHPSAPLRILALGGDGIGPEVVGAALQVLHALVPAFLPPPLVTTAPLGMAALRELGQVAPPPVLRQAAEADAVLVGAVDTLGLRELGGVGQGSAILALRRALGCFAALRPVRCWPDPFQWSPLRPERRSGVDLLFVRELSAGAYGPGPHRQSGSRPRRRAVDALRYEEGQVGRVTRLAFELARGRRRQVTSVDLAEHLQTSRLWRQVVEEVAAGYPDVELERRPAGQFAQELVSCPSRFDVVLTANLLGDILSDQGAAISGSLGILASSARGPDRLPRLYEPVHGAAPDLAGTGRANPLGAILTLALLLADQGAAAAAGSVEAAIRATLASGTVTPDMGGTASTGEVVCAVISHLARTPGPGWDAGARRDRALAAGGRVGA